MKSQVKLQKTAEVTYIEANKQETSFRVTYLEVRRKKKKRELLFWWRKHKMKNKCYVFSSHKQRNKVWMVYLECKLQQDRYRSCIFKLESYKTVETKYLETSQQQTKYR